MSDFKIISQEGKARAGILKTAHGEVKTPVFMPVGTVGSVKALSPEDLTKAGVQIILGNTYHLYLRPGAKLIKKMGGLHQFMSWDKPILTDSGGFQAFSLGAMIEHGVRKVQKNSENQENQNNKEPEFQINQKEKRVQPLFSKMIEDGIEFVSHLDGSKHLLTPEKSLEVQLDLGADICLVLDELLSPLHDPGYVKNSLERTHRWEQRSREYFTKNRSRSLNPKALLFGILQGVYDQKIRENEAKWVAGQEFEGVSIGGSMGTSQYYGLYQTNWVASEAIAQTLDWVIPYLPPRWPKHILGIGEVEDLFNCVQRGADMFDCVSATRRARNGSLYVSPKEGGKISNEQSSRIRDKFAILISNSEYKDNPKPIDQNCNCYTCQNFSRAYLRHLYSAKELLYYRLASLHNVYFITKLMAEIRQAILEKRFGKLKEKWIG